MYKVIHFISGLSKDHVSEWWIICLQNFFTKFEGHFGTGGGPGCLITNIITRDLDLIDVAGLGKFAHSSNKRIPNSFCRLAPKAYNGFKLRA